MKLIYERNTWLMLSNVREEIKQKIIKNVTSVHKILGDIFLKQFIFEYT